MKKKVLILLGFALIIVGLINLIWPILEAISWLIIGGIIGVGIFTVGKIIFKILKKM